MKCLPLITATLAAASRTGPLSVDADNLLQRVLLSHYDDDNNKHGNDDDDVNDAGSGVHVVCIELNEAHAFQMRCGEELSLSQIYSSRADSTACFFAAATSEAIWACPGSARHVKLAERMPPAAKLAKSLFRARHKKERVAPGIIIANDRFFRPQRHEHFGGSRKRPSLADHHSRDGDSEPASTTTMMPTIDGLTVTFHGLSSTPHEGWLRELLLQRRQQPPSLWQWNEKEGEWKIERT